MKQKRKAGNLKTVWSEGPRQAWRRDYCKTVVNRKKTGPASQGRRRKKKTTWLEKQEKEVSNKLGIGGYTPPLAGSQIFDGVRLQENNEKKTEGRSSGRKKKTAELRMTRIENSQNTGTERIFSTLSNSTDKDLNNIFMDRNQQRYFSWIVTHTRNTYTAERNKKGETIDGGAAFLK